MKHQKIKIIFMLSLLFCAAPAQSADSPDEGSPGYRSPEDQVRDLFQPKRLERRASPVRAPLDVKHVQVLQQKSDQPFFLHGTNLETQGDGTVFGQRGLPWRNVRMYDNTNCGYHALKNVRTLMGGLQDPGVPVAADLANPRSLLHQQLNSPEHLIPDLASWVSHVYQERREELHKKVPDDNPATLKSNRSRLPEHLKSYVNANDGSIKVDDLGGQELEKLIKTEVPEIKHNVVVMEYTPGIPGILDEQVQMSPAMQARIARFQASQNDVMGILWNEENFHHWVGYVAHKENGKVTVYAMNSISAKQPANIAKLYQMLTPS